RGGPYPARVYLVALQFDIAWQERDANFKTVSRLLNEANPEAGALVAFPEMFAPGFSMDAAVVAEPPGGPTEQFLSQAAAQWKIHLVAGVAIQAGKDGRPR